MAAKLFFIILTIVLYFVLIATVSKKKSIAFSSLIKPFLLGCLSTVPIILIKTAGIPLSWQTYLIPLLVAPCLEESSKGMCATFLPRIQHAPYLIGGVIGLGFACTENILFISGDLLFLSGNMLVFIGLRLFLDTIAHFLFTSLFTRFSQQQNIGLGLLLAIVLHGTFNLIMSIGMFFILIPLFLITTHLLRLPIRHMA